MVNEINEAGFAAQIASKTPSMIEFYASWCPSCDAARPLLEKFANENPHISVCALNVDENPAIVAQYHVMGVPTFIAMKDGKVIARTTGQNNLRGILDCFN